MDFVWRTIPLPTVDQHLGYPGRLSQAETHTEPESVGDATTSLAKGKTRKIFITFRKASHLNSDLWSPQWHLGRNTASNPSSALQAAIIAVHARAWRWAAQAACGCRFRVPDRHGSEIPSVMAAFWKLENVTVDET
jgi:hypothetical protein